MSFWQTLSLFTAPIGAAVLGLLVLRDQRRDQRRLAESLKRK